MQRPILAIVGNPNAGKSTLFNLLTDGDARVGNYPGVTVETRSGPWRQPGELAPGELHPQVFRQGPDTLLG